MPTLLCRCISTCFVLLWQEWLLNFHSCSQSLPLKTSSNCIITQIQSLRSHFLPTAAAVPLDGAFNNLTTSRSPRSSRIQGLPCEGASLKWPLIVNLRTIAWQVLREMPRTAEISKYEFPLSCIWRTNSRSARDLLGAIANQEQSYSITMNLEMQEVSINTCQFSRFFRCITCVHNELDTHDRHIMKCCPCKWLNVNDGTLFSLQTAL